MPENEVIGKRHSRADAYSKVTGSAIYAADLCLPNMLHGKILWSNVAHAKIVRINTEKARALPGVKAVITASDAPPQHKNNPYPNPMLPCLVEDRILFAGQPIAAVAAVTREIAEEAVRLIEVEYEELTPVLDAVEAMKPGSSVIYPEVRTNENRESGSPTNLFWYTKNIRGDVETGFKSAHVVLENTYHTSIVHQGYMEPRATVASADASGKITVWNDNQGTFEARELICEFLGIPLNYVKVVPVESGGAFGGKSHQVFGGLCALLSQKTLRPVKLVTTREEVLKVNRPAAPAVITVKLGADKTGRLTAAAVKMVYDFGAAYGMGGTPAIPVGSITGLNPYSLPNLQVETFSVLTNKTPSGPYRGPSAPQAAFAIESQIDEMVKALKMDPIEFRLKNAPEEGDLMTAGGAFARIGCKQVLVKMRDYLAGREKWEGEGKGRGVACGFWFGGAGTAGINLLVNDDGTISAVIGSVDVSGTRTIVAQYIAEEMGIQYEDVTVVTGDTDSAPFSVLSAGSMIARALVTPTLKACDILKEELCKRAAPRLQADLKDLEYIKGRVQIKGKPEKSLSLSHIAADVCRVMESRITAEATGKAVGRGQVYSVQTAEIEVDKETGKVKIKHYAVVQDVGCAVNPMLLEGQIQGAVAQGIGWGLWEKSDLEKGVVKNATLLDYRVPTALDVPKIDVMLVEVPHPTTPFGIRGAGEAPLVPGPGTIANAINSATGVRINHLPMDPETVFRALHAKK